MYFLYFQLLVLNKRLLGCLIRHVWQKTSLINSLTCVDGYIKWTREGQGQRQREKEKEKKGERNMRVREQACKIVVNIFISSYYM